LIDHNQFSLCVRLYDAGRQADRRDTSSIRNRQIIDRHPALNSRQSQGRHILCHSVPIRRQIRLLDTIINWANEMRNSTGLADLRQWNDPPTSAAMASDQKMTAFMPFWAVRSGILAPEHQSKEARESEKQMQILTYNRVSSVSPVPCCARRPATLGLDRSSDVDEFEKSQLCTNDFSRPAPAKSATASSMPSRAVQKKNFLLRIGISSYSALPTLSFRQSDKNRGCDSATAKDWLPHVATYAHEAECKTFLKGKSHIIDEVVSETSS